jgi:hypothetical protein
VNESAAFGAAVSARLRAAPAWTITALAGVIYVIAAPPSTDLAAAAYRSDLFSRVGFTLWDNSWYGGHHLLAYSLLAPALGALIGPQPLTAISMTVLAGLFAVLLGDLFPKPAARAGALWLAAGAAVGLLANRVPFDLGLAIGLGALLAARGARRHARLAPGAVVLVIACSAASPVAGVFLALALLAWAIAERSVWTLALAVLALAPIAVLAVMFPEGGTQPFVASAFYPALAGVLFLFAVIPGRERALRLGALLYAAALIGAYALPSAVGGNVDRLGALFAGPLAACMLTGRGRVARITLLLAALPLIYWQVNAPLADFLAARSDAGVDASYYTPLIGELRALGIGYSGRPARIEVVPEKNHWEARWVAPVIPLARGWERQLDARENAIFYGESRPLSAARYRAWLSDEAVSYVALADYPLDYSAKAEARLLRSARPSYLREVWHSRHWRLFAVLGARPLAESPSSLTAMSSDSFTLRAPRPGTFTVRVHFSAYWGIAGGSGCVRRAPGGWTQVQAHAAGSLRVAIAFSLARVFDHGSRCA